MSRYDVFFSFLLNVSCVELKWIFWNIYLQSFLDIVVELEKLDQLSSEKMDLIEQSLRSIHRADLAKKISQYQQTGKNYQLCVVVLDITNI